MKTILLHIDNYEYPLPNAAPTGIASNDTAENKEETEEDIDFGYWESAILDDKPSSTTVKSQPAVSSTAQDVDLL